MNDNSPERVAAGFGQAALGLAEALETALPGNANARFELASALMKQEATEEAAALFAAHPETVPEDSDAWLKVPTQGSRGCRA